MRVNEVLTALFCSPGARAFQAGLPRYPLPGWPGMGPQVISMPACSSPASSCELCISEAPFTAPRPFKKIYFMSKTTIDGVGHKVDYAVKSDASISRDQIREWLVKDMRGVYLLLSELLNSPQCVDALTDIFYARYQDMHKSKSEGND